MFITVLVLEGSARLFYETTKRQGQCVIEHPTASYQNESNCTYKEKLVENDNPITYIFNSCGYRTPFECGEKVPGSIRIVSLGDSFMAGLMSPIEDHFIIRMLDKLTDGTEGFLTVDWQNLGTSGYNPLQYYVRFDEALSLEPDLVIIGITPNDLFQDNSLSQLVGQEQRVPPISYSSFDLIRLLKRLISESRALTVGSTYLLSSDEIYYQMYIARGEDSDYLSTPLSRIWQERVAQIALLIEKMNAKAKDKETLLLVVFIPQRIQKVIMTTGRKNKSIDPFLLPQQLRVALEKLGVHFVDGLDAFRQVPSEESLYFPVNGHLTPIGNHFLGDFLAKEVLEEDKLRGIFDSR